VDEVLDGRLSAGGFAALPIVFGAAGRDGSRALLAGAMVEDAAHPVSVLLHRTGSDIATVADLRGRRVGILPTAAYRGWIAQVLRHAGVDPAAVTVTPVAPALQASALAEGGVDALFTNDPMATAIVAQGVGERFGPEAPVPDALGGPLLFGSFLIHPKLRAEQPEVARALVAALDEAAARIDADPAAAREAMRAFVRPAEQPFVDRYPPARYVPSAQVDDAALRDEARRELEGGLIERPLDVGGWSFAGVAP
jgi:ABC-type nitrate/sulfonate/bicarbonate transport system substrate-binding protein